LLDLLLQPVQQRRLACAVFALAVGDPGNTSAVMPGTIINSMCFVHAAAGVYSYREFGATASALL
jgi:hypothetical protein